MFFRTFFVCLVGFVLAKSGKQHEKTGKHTRHKLKITFEITSKTDKDGTKIICDHNINDIQKNIYTVREGEEFRIFAKSNSYINHFTCSNTSHLNEYFTATTKETGNLKNEITFKVEKRMGTLWNCTVLAHRDNPTMLPVVQYKGHTYSAAYCFMKIHVRQTNSPQTILVNNMVLQAVRTDLSEKDVDFIAEYQYADGDVVDVTCANFLNPAQLTMEYAMAGTMSDNSTMADLFRASYSVIGFVAKLHSGHNNSYMICTNTESTDYSKVMVRFVMRTGFNIVSIAINGMTLRPILTIAANNYYKIQYKYLSNQYINVICEVQRTDTKLVVVDDLISNLSGYKTKELIQNKKTEMWFYLNSKDENKLTCAADYIPRGSAEQVAIYFTAVNFPIDEHPLHMKLPSNGTVMELYNDNKLKVIYYEVEDGETLELNCGPLLFPSGPGPVLYLRIELPNGSTDYCKEKNCTLSKTLNVTRKEYENSTIVCYLKEEIDTNSVKKKDKVLREIRVILRERVLTTTSTTTSTTSKSTTTTPKSTKTSHASNHSHAPPVSGAEGYNENSPNRQWMTIAVIAGAAFCITIICVSIVIVKLRKRNHSQGGPHNRNYENLQTPSETSIPAYPPQWESNYAVPVDRRAEDTTYSVPCQEPALYSTPTPKNQRNKKQKPVDPTYAILEVQNARGRKNAFKETEDPNYSEVYANRQEQCYAKVLPKSVRNKMVQDNNPYSYVTNEPAYATPAEPEPMYCEPAKAQGGTYANLNNDHYANSNAQEYVEPTYCEPQKRKK